MPFQTHLVQNRKMTGGTGRHLIFADKVDKGRGNGAFGVNGNPLGSNVVFKNWLNKSRLRKMADVDG